MNPQKIMIPRSTVKFLHFCFKFYLLSFLLFDQFFYSREWTLFFVFLRFQKIFWDENEEFGHECPTKISFVKNVQSSKMTQNSLFQCSNFDSKTFSLNFRLGCKKISIFDSEIKSFNSRLGNQIFNFRLGNKKFQFSTRKSNF